MRCKAVISQIYRDYARRRWLLTIETEQDVAQDYERLKDKDLTVELKEFRKHRSLSANAYYWQLLSKICECTGESVSYRHNLNLRECGYIELVDGKAVYLVIPDTEEAAEKVDHYADLHLRPTAQVKSGKDGERYRTYMLLRGSHTFDTKEMSRLIEIVVEQADACGIETATPEELERMMQIYGVKHGETID